MEQKCLTLYFQASHYKRQKNKTAFLIKSLISVNVMPAGGFVRVLRVKQKEANLFIMLVVHNICF